MLAYVIFFFFSSRRRHTRWPRDWSSDVCSSDLDAALSHGRSARPAPGHHAPVSARQGRRGAGRDPRGRRRQDHPGDRMTLGTRLVTELEQFKRDGVYKRLNYLESPQAARARMQGRGEIVILSSNNYLGLCNEPEVVAAGHRALDEFGA